MTLVVAPVLQFKLPLQPLAVNVATSVPHIVLLSVTILGVLGFTPVRITISFELTLLPHVLLHVAV
jgi:hypothetical protein